LAVAELGLYALVITNMQIGNKGCAFVNSILLVFAIGISASRKSVISPIFDNQISKFLGTFSLYIYLCQSPARQIIYNMYPDILYGKAYMYIFTLTMILAVLGMLCIHIVRFVANMWKGCRV
jgi:peptidoglycan/LPS O-acetylase OafA/YrhL